MKTKKAIKYFSIMQYKAEEEYLRSMHRSGWKLVSVSGLCVYHFEQCEPMDAGKDGVKFHLLHVLQGELLTQGAGNGIAFRGLTIRQPPCDFRYV